MEVVGLETAEAGKALLTMLLMHATSPAFTYFHAWDVGDVLVWDNTQAIRARSHVLAARGVNPGARFRFFSAQC